MNNIFNRFANQKYSKDTLAATALILIIILPFLPALLFKMSFITMSMQFSDLMLENYPLKAWYWDMIRSHQFPFWTTLMGNGYPIFAEGQIGPLYPVNFILAYLNPIFAFKLEYVFHILLAAVFSYFFCRVSLKFPIVYSFFAAVIFSLSGFFSVYIHIINIILVASYLPLVFLITERIASSGKLYWCFILSLVFSLVLLAGQLQISFYILILAGIYLSMLILTTKENLKINGKLKIFGLFLASILLSFFISSPQLLVSLELIGYSLRSAGLNLQAAGYGALPFWSFILFFAPHTYDLYGLYPDLSYLIGSRVDINFLYGYAGLIPLILTLSSLFLVIKNRFALIFTIILLFSLAYGLGTQTVFFRIFWEIVPGFKIFRDPRKILFAIEFCIAILASLQLKNISFWLSKKFPKNQKLPLIFSCLVILLVYIDLIFNNFFTIQKIQPDSGWFDEPKLGIYLNKELRGKKFRVTSMVFKDLKGPDFNSLRMQSDLKNMLYIDSNITYKIPENIEYSGLDLIRNNKLNITYNDNNFNTNYDLDPEKKVFTPSNRIKKALFLQNVKYVISFLPIEDPDFNLKITYPLSKKLNYEAAVISDGKTTPLDIQVGSIYLYEIKNTLPRSVFVSSIKIMDEEQEVDEILKEDFDPAKKVILEDDLNFKDSQLTEKVEPKITNYQENNLDIEVNAPKEGFVVLSDTYYPGWKAKVDGEETQIYKANYDFRAVRVSSGKHNIHMEYEPTNWRIYIAISCLTLIFTLSGLIYCLIFKK